MINKVVCHDCKKLVREDSASRLSCSHFINPRGWLYWCRDCWKKDSEEEVIDDSKRVWFEGKRDNGKRS